MTSGLQSREEPSLVVMAQQRPVCMYHTTSYHGPQPFLMDIYAEVYSILTGEGQGCVCDIKHWSLLHLKLGLVPDVSYSHIRVHRIVGFFS